MQSNYFCDIQTVVIVKMITFLKKNKTLCNWLEYEQSLSPIETWWCTDLKAKRI